MNKRADSLDDDLIKLDKELKLEELRQLRSGKKVRWITPAALAILLPVLGGFGLWVFDQVKTLNEGYAAIVENRAIKVEKSELVAQKDSLNLEIVTLLALKNHHSAEAVRLGKIVEERQALVDQIYLKAKYAASESVYALAHVLKGTQPIDKKAFAKVIAEIAKMEPALGRQVGDLFQRYDMFEAMSSTTDDILKDFLDSLKTISPSAEALALDWNPAGLFGTNRQLMSDTSADKPRYYDVGIGRYLTDAEVSEMERERQ